MKKIFLNLIFLAVISTFIVGCSSESNRDSSSSTNTDGNKEGPVELVYVSTQNEESMNRVIKAFEEKNPDIKIKNEVYPFRQLFETLEVKMGAKSTDVDLLDVDVPLVASYAVKGYLAPLDDLISEDAKSNWVDSAIEASSYQDQLMAPPINTSSQVLYYNKEIFEEKGVTPPPNDVEKRWTWEQVVEAAQKLTYDLNGDGQTDIFGIGFDQISRPYQILPLPQSLGADQLDESGIVSTGYTNSAKSIEAAQFYYDLFNTWKVSPKIPVEQSAEYFATGKTAMFISGPWEVDNLKESDIEYGFAPHPYFEGGEVVTPTGSWHIGISQFSKKKEAAAKFVEFLTIGEGADLWFEERGVLPAHLGILQEIKESADYEEFPANINRLAAYEAENTAVPRPITPGYLEWESLVNKAYEDIKNGSDPKESLDDAVQQIDRQLKKYESVVNGK
ncbi:bicyclomycin resistance protein [Bacillus sp. J14TS2]|uniref:ABC transporter substrate-binding protein n=1 Tax=Bacillus sp. J14TS2 TaxID=2807188 RepID=UPI001B19EEDB|nr:sugar ABC transporter substrate-binding protein [Bacillus sp. J14TS2]GIN71438.1 bicyclomycin resistance protein [Bacillus sp. J14TS2]